MILRVSMQANKKGFSLIEVLVAISILSVGIVGVLRAYAKALDSLEVGKDYIDSVLLVKEKMGEIEQSIIENNGFVPENTSGNFSGDFSFFSWKLTRDLISDGRLNEVALSVMNDNSKRSLVISTYLKAPSTE